MCDNGKKLGENFIVGDTTKRHTPRNLKRIIEIKKNIYIKKRISILRFSITVARPAKELIDAVNASCK